MTEFFDYIYYRTCRWSGNVNFWRRRGYKKRLPVPGGRDAGLFACWIVVNLTTILNLCRWAIVRSGVESRAIFHAFDVAILALWMAGILVVYFIYEYRFDDRKSKTKAYKRWKALCERYADEPVYRRRLRGWGVLLYYVLSFTAMVGSFFLFRVQ